MKERSQSGYSPVLEATAGLLRDAELGQGRLLVLESTQAVLQSPSGRVLRVLLTPATVPDICGVIDHALARNSGSGSELLLVGGDAHTKAIIQRAVPQLRMHTFYVHHLSDEGVVSTWPNKKGHHIAQALTNRRSIDHRQEQELYARAAFDQAKIHDEQRERLFFFRELGAKKSPATFGLLVAILVVFMLQLYWSRDILGALGVREWGPQMEQYWLVLAIAMGALWTPDVLNGELWRGISVGFLHFNLIHIAANSFVLYMLGTQLEKVLGSARFIIIYTVSLLGGSLASTFLTDGVAVGASGAIWGLLGAQVALAYDRPPVLPPSIARAIKPIALRNLVLNVGISFIGGIDWAAHFGGGLAGGLLLASGLLYPKQHGSSTAYLESRSLVWGAAVAILVLVSGVVASLLVGQPWRLAAQFSQ